MIFCYFSGLEGMLLHPFGNGLAGLVRLRRGDELFPILTFYESRSSKAHHNPGRRLWLLAFLAVGAQPLQLALGNRFSVSRRAF